MVQRSSQQMACHSASFQLLFWCLVFMRSLEYNWLLLRAPNVTWFKWRLNASLRGWQENLVKKTHLLVNRVFLYTFLCCPLGFIFIYFLLRFHIFYDSLLIHVALKQKSLGFPDTGAFKICSIPQFWAKVKGKDNIWVQGDPKLDKGSPSF